MAVETLQPKETTQGGGVVFQKLIADTTEYVCEIPNGLIGSARLSYYGTWNGRSLPVYESNDGTNYGACLNSSGAAIAPTANGEQQIIGDGYGPVRQIKIGPASGSGTSILVTLTCGRK